MYIEALRRIYHDLVVRRSTVRMVPTIHDLELSRPPIFLIGAYRSGTTLLRYIVNSHSSIACPPESDFLGPLSQLTDGNMRYHNRLDHMGYDIEHIRKKLSELALYFFNNYALSNGKSRWADKSPSYVDYMDFILELFPDAQFVMIYRNGLDQADSFTRGGTLKRNALDGYCQTDEDLRLGAVRYWHEKVNKMMEFETTYPEKCYRIHYEKLCQEPEKHLQSLFKFLEEPWEPHVLEFYKHQHDIGAEDGRAAATTGFVISQGHYKSWPTELLTRSLAIAGSTLDKLGYSKQEINVK